MIANAKYYRGILDALPERVVRYRLPDMTVVYCNSAWAAGHRVEPADSAMYVVKKAHQRGRSELSRV